MGKKKGKKKRAPKQDDDPFGDTDGIFGEAKASREKEVLATPIAAEELKLDGGSVSPPFEEITPEEMEEMEAARERAAEEKAAAARAAAKAEAEAAAAEEAARKAEEEAAAAEAAEKAAAEAKAAESSEGESTETAPAPTSLGVDIEDDNDEDDMLSLLDSLEEKAKESKSVSPKAPTPTEKLAKAKAEVDSLFDDFDADNAAQDDADMAAILAMVNEDPEVRIARARAKAEEEEAAERQAAEEAEAKAKAEAEAEAKAKAEAAAAAEEEAKAKAEAEAEAQAKAEAEAQAKAEAEAEAQAKAEAEAQAKAEAEAEAQAKAEAEAKAEEEAKMKAEEEAAKLKAAEEAEAKVAEEAKVEAEAQAIADAEAANPSQVDVEPQSDAAEGAAKPETDPQPDTSEASNDGDTADTDPAVAAAEPPAAENDNDSDGYVHIDASDEAAPLDEPAASTQESKEVEPDLDSADDEFVQAGEEVEDADPTELAKQLQAAKAALAASRAQQSQLQTQLGAVRAECGVLREDLERSEEATEQVQEVSAETMLQCSQLEAKLADATARIAELTSAAAGAKELQALLDAANQDIAAKDTLIASDLDEIKRYQGLADAAKAKAEEAVKNVAVETEALVAQVAEARAEADRMRTLFDGKEIELRDANAMAREASTRAVTAEEKVDEVVKVNDDLLRELKTSQGQLEAAKAEAEEALLMRETQLVEKEQLVSSAEKKIVTLEEDLRKLNSAHDELQVTAAGDKAALQARIDRKTAELDQLAGSIDEADTEKEELRAKMAATQAHAVQVQKAALKYDQEAKAELEEMRQAAAAQKTKLEQYVHDNVELSAKVEDLRTQLELSDGRIRELVGSNPSDPRTEIVRLRMTLTTFEQERARYEAKITNLTAQLDGVTAALKATTTRASELQSTIDNTVDRSGQLAVAENMAKLLEDEAKTLRERISKEVSDRVNAETALAQMQLDLKHTKKKVDSLESDLAVARSSAGFGASSGLMGAPASGMTLGGDAGSSLYGSGASSAVTTSIGGIEYFNPQSYGSYNKGYGGGGGAAIGGGNSFATSMTEIDTMRDLKLAEDRAKAAEKREAAVLEKLHKIEAEAAGLRTHGEKSGYIGIDVHTRLIDMADERARDADRKVRDLETEIISLRNRARVGKGLQYLEGPDPQVTALLSKLNQCVIGAKRILPDSGGANLTEADFAEQAARDERAWKARMAEQERRREEAERSLAVAVDQEVQRRAELGLPVSGVPEHKSPLPTSAVDKAPAEPAAAPEDPTAKRVPPATTPKPKKKEKGSVHDKVQAFSDGGPATDEPVKSDYKPVSSPAPRRLNNALMSKIAGSIPGAAAVGATAADIMKAARRQRADTVEGEDDDDEWDGEEGQHIPHASEMPPPAQAQPAAAAATEPSEPSEPAAGTSTDDLVGEVVKAPSLTGQFARPQIQRGKRLPSRKKSKSAMSPAVPTDEPEAEPAETAAPPQPKPTPLAAAMPPPKTRAPADSDEEEEDDEDWGEEESPAPPSKAALMARMAKLAGANRPGGGMPLPVVTPQPHDDADEVEPAAEPVAATPPVQKKKAPPSPAPSPKPVVKPPPKETAKKPPPPVKQKTPKVAPKVAKKSPKPGPKKAEERSESKPPATPTPEVDKPTKVPAPTQLFAASDDSDLFASAKPAKTKGGKKKGTSLFNLSDDSDDDWLK